MNTSIQERYRCGFRTSVPMNSDQQVASTGSRPPTVYDQKYVDFVENVLKEAADDFEREKKCTWYSFLPLSSIYERCESICTSFNLVTFSNDIVRRNIERDKVKKSATKNEEFSLFFTFFLFILR